MSWPLVKISDVAIFIRNGLSVKQDDSGAGVPITRIETIANRNFDLSRCGYAGILAEDFSDYLLQNGDILISHINSEKHLGKCAIYEFENFDLIHGMNLLCLRVNEEIAFPKYLFHCLSSKIFLRQISKITKKSVNQASFTVPSFKDLEIILPPISEQKRIAAILDKADSIRRKRQQAIKLADEFLRAVFLDMFGDPVTNPKGWPIGTIRDLATSVSYGTSEKAHETIGEFPVLRMMNITYEGKWDFTSLKYIDLDEKGKEKYLVFPGDLLFNRTNSKELVGKTAVYERTVPMAYAGYLIRLRTNELANPHYIAAYLNSAHGKMTLLNMCKSIVGMANINAQELQDIKICIPPIELQNKFAAITSAIRTHEKKMTDTDAEMEALFLSLSQKAFSGLL